MAPDGHISIDFPPFDCGQDLLLLLINRMWMAQMTAISPMIMLYGKDEEILQM